MIEIEKGLKGDKEEVVTRVKALIITSDDKILLGHSHCEYQFPGGHLENNEDIKVALKRELQEETGLEFEEEKMQPFAKLTRYIDDCELNIYYFLIHDDRVPNLANTNYTEEELDGNYTLRYVPLNIVIDVLNENMYRCGDPQGIVMEMVEILEKYFEMN